MSSGSYYTIGLTVVGAGTSAFYAINPVDGLDFFQGGFNCYPNGAGSVSVAIYPQVAQLQMPAAEYIGGSVSLQTLAPSIDGMFTISPPIDVDARLTLYGAGGQTIGTVILAGGEPSVSFQWKVSPGEGMSAEEAKSAVEGSLKRE